jgi:hypothetical protein
VGVPSWWGGPLGHGAIHAYADEVVTGGSERYVVDGVIVASADGTDEPRTGHVWMVKSVCVSVCECV